MRNKVVGSIGIPAALFFAVNILLCSVSHASARIAAPASDSALQEDTSSSPAEKEIEQALSWLEGKSTNKADALRKLRQEDPNEFDRQIRKVLKQRLSEFVRDMIFGTIGGLGLFLFGMGLMSDGLKRVAGQKLKSLLESLTKNRFLGVSVGALTTALIQSSSATTVMVVGFVNAGLLGLKQALSVVLGANVGTTFTAWIVSTFGIGGLKITQYTLPAIGLGFLLRIVGRRQRDRSLGDILLGFGLLFVGISFMKDGFDPLKDSVAVQQALIWLGKNPILAVLAGTAITMLLQSSSASIMMIQVLALQGAFGHDWELVLRVTIPFILGDNIGTTITAQLAALQTSRASKRVAMGHTVFNAIGVLYILPFVWTGLFARLVMWVTPWALSQNTIMVHIAVAHSTFNVVNTLVFLPMLNWLEKVVMKLIPVSKQELSQQPVVLEKHLFDTPVIAIGQAKREIVRMARTAKTGVECCIKGILNDDRKDLRSARQIEDCLDKFQYEITSYLSELSRKELSEELSVGLPVLLHTVNDLERVGDHAVNVVEIAERKIEQKLEFSESAVQEAEQLRKEAEQMFDRVIAALEKDDIKAAKSALVNEANLNRMQIDFRRSHVQRMTEQVCSAEAGLIFIDLVDNVEKIGDHLSNIAQAVVGGLQWDGVDVKIPPPEA